MLMFGDSNGGGGSSNNNNKQQYKISNEWCIDCYVIVSYLSCYFTRPSQTKWTDCENCLKRVWVCLWMCVCLHVCSVFGVIFFFFLQKRLTSLFLIPPSLTLLLFLFLSRPCSIARIVHLWLWICSTLVFRSLFIHSSSSLFAAFRSPSSFGKISCVFNSACV